MHCSRPVRRVRHRAFTLVELMIVIVIIGLLAGMVTLNVRSYMQQARQSTAKAEIATVVQALGTFYATYGRYPTNEEGLDWPLRGPPKNSRNRSWRGRPRTRGGTRTSTCRPARPRRSRSSPTGRTDARAARGRTPTSRART